MKDLMLQSLKYALKDYYEESRKISTAATAWRRFFTRCRDTARYGHTNSQEALKKLNSSIVWYINKLNNAESAMEVFKWRQQFTSIVDDMCKKKINRIVKI